MRYCHVTDHIFTLIRQLEEARRKPKDYGGGTLLNHAEVQFLDTIARFPDKNVSGLSGQLGITKGAVTQLVTKLSQKNLILEVQREDNKKEKFFRLTPQGARVVTSHHLFHKEANDRLCTFMKTLTPDESAAVYRFLEFIKTCVPFSESPCACHAHVNDAFIEKEYQHERNVAIGKQPVCHP